MARTVNPGLPGATGANRARRRRILLRLQDASRKRPSRTGHAEHKRGSARGDSYPHHEMFRECAARKMRVIARSAAMKQSSLRLLSGLLRGACHRAALCADPLARNDDRRRGRIAFNPSTSSPRKRGPLTFAKHNDVGDPFATTLGGYGSPPARERHRMC